MFGVHFPAVKLIRVLFFFRDAFRKSQYVNPTVSTQKNLVTVQTTLSKRVNRLFFQVFDIPQRFLSPDPLGKTFAQIQKQQYDVTGCNFLMSNGTLNQGPENYWSVDRFDVFIKFSWGPGSQIAERREELWRAPGRILLVLDRYCWRHPPLAPPLKVRPEFGHYRRQYCK